ncbi:MAG: winged helix-turn-helix domain-containing protein [Candidatus Bathyarchaeia archaeon]
MPKRRTRYEIKAEILNLCKEPQTSTLLLVKVGRFGGYYAKYVRELLDKKLLAKQDKTYITTEKGLLWLNAYRQLKQLEEE